MPSIANMYTIWQTTSGTLLGSGSEKTYDYMTSGEHVARAAHPELNSVSPIKSYGQAAQLQSILRWKRISYEQLYTRPEGTKNIPTGVPELHIIYHYCNGSCFSAHT